MINNLKRGRNAGFTLIELLVVILILAILMAVALPLYLNSQKNAERQTCRSNQQTIANAVQAAKVSTRASNYSAFIGATVNSTNEPDLGATPVCPSGGTYSIANGHTGDNTTFQVACSFAGPPAHGHFEPGVDSN